MHGEGAEDACGVTARPGWSGVNIDAPAGCIRRFVTASVAWQCPAALVTTGVKDHRNLPPAPVTTFATIALMQNFDSPALGFRVFSDMCRANCARDSRSEVVGLEALHPVFFGNECQPLHRPSI